MYAMCYSFCMETKVCSYCKQSVPLENFHKSKNHTFGRVSVCKPCQASYSAKWYEQNKDRMKERMRITAYMRKYGITIEEYEILLAEQNGCCAICLVVTGSDGKRLSVDHNHETGEVRGLLCDNCNTGLGMFKDNPSLLAKAINYLN